MKKKYVKPEIKGIREVINNSIMCGSMCGCHHHRHGNNDDQGFDYPEPRDPYPHPNSMWDEPCSPPQEPHNPGW